jgi:hypothetical protein
LIGGLARTIILNAILERRPSFNLMAMEHLGRFQSDYLRIFVGFYYFLSFAAGFCCFLFEFWDLRVN